MKNIKRKLLNKKDLKKIDTILRSEKDIRVFKRALVLRAADLGYTQDSIVIQWKQLEFLIKKRMRTFGSSTDLDLMKLCNKGFFGPI